MPTTLQILHFWHMTPQLKQRVFNDYKARSRTASSKTGPTTNRVLDVHGPCDLCIPIPKNKSDSARSNMVVQSMVCTETQRGQARTQLLEPKKNHRTSAQCGCVTAHLTQNDFRLRIAIRRRFCTFVRSAAFGVLDLLLPKNPSTIHALNHEKRCVSKD